MPPLSHFYTLSQMACVCLNMYVSTAVLYASGIKPCRLRWRSRVYFYLTMWTHLQIETGKLCFELTFIKVCTHAPAYARASFVLNNARPCTFTIISIFKSILSKWTDFCRLWDGVVGGGLMWRMGEGRAEEGLGPEVHRGGI